MRKLSARALPARSPTLRVADRDEAPFSSARLDCDLQLQRHVTSSATTPARIEKLFSCSLFAAALAIVPGCGSVPGKASPNDPAGNFSQVSPGIYRGGRPDQPGVLALAKMGVKTIIDLEMTTKR